MSNEKPKLVYSTDKTVSRRERPGGKFRREGVSGAQQKVYVRLERKGRGGKTVTIIDGFRMPLKEIEELHKQLKMKLGTGGTINDTSLEIQGDHRDMVMSTLKGIGFAPKRSGG